VLPFICVSLNRCTDRLLSIGYGENYSARVSLKCAAPTALGKRLAGLPALTGWANVWRAYGAQERQNAQTSMPGLMRFPTLRVGLSSAAPTALGKDEKLRLLSRTKGSAGWRGIAKHVCRARYIVPLPNPSDVQLSKGIRLSSRERAKSLAIGRLADCRARDYCPFVQQSCHLYFFNLDARENRQENFKNVTSGSDFPRCDLPARHKSGRAIAIKGLLPARLTQVRLVTPDFQKIGLACPQAIPKRRGL
jgi:hypothetical protein